MGASETLRPRCTSESRRRFGLRPPRAHRTRRITAAPARRRMAPRPHTPRSLPARASNLFLRRIGPDSARLDRIPPDLTGSRPI